MMQRDDNGVRIVVEDVNPAGPLSKNEGGPGRRRGRRGRRREGGG